jgi:glycosyltransferase involved in cell wall biosynthesis
MPSNTPITGEMVSIVLPVHNQADHVEAVVASYEEALAGLACRHELILVTNACRDDSPALCRELDRRIESVRAIDSAAGGWGLALKLGLRAAEGTLLAYTNSARTSANQLLSLLKKALECPNIVVKATRLGRPGVRKLGSSLYNWECRLLLGVPCRDVNGTPKIFPRHFNKLLQLTRDDDLIDLEFLSICRREGYPIMEVPIVAQKRHGGDSTTRLASAWKLYSGAYRMWRSASE